MDNKEFDEIMKKYVESTKNPIEKDFHKLNEMQSENNKKHFKIPKFAWAAMAIIIIISVSLAVFLPLYLNKDDGDDGIIPSEEPTIRYYDDDDLTSDTIESLTSMYEKHDFPQIKEIILDYISEHITVFMDAGEANKIVGVFLDYFVFDDNIENLKIYTVPIEYDLHNTADYKDLQLQKEWKSVIVSFDEATEDGYLYVHRLKFTESNINYFIEAQCYMELDVADLLDMLY